MNAPITCQGCCEKSPAIRSKVILEIRQSLFMKMGGVVFRHRSQWLQLVTHACMNKSDYSCAKYCHVYSFIPTDQLPRDTPHKYDIFFKPLESDRRIRVSVH